MSAISLIKETQTGASIWANPLMNFAATQFQENLPIKNDAFNSAISAAFSSIGNTLSDNISRGTRLTSGLMSNTWDSLAGAGVGLASSQIGKGISNIGNNSPLSMVHQLDKQQIRLEKLLNFHYLERVLDS